MEKNDFNQLMDDVIERKLLDGNSAQEPKKQVRIMVITFVATTTCLRLFALPRDAHVCIVFAPNFFVAAACICRTCSSSCQNWLLQLHCTETHCNQVCADFEDSSIPQEKFFHWTPLPIDDLPPFRLCHPKYWEEAEQKKKPFGDGAPIKPQILEINEAKSALSKLSKCK